MQSKPAKWLGLCKARVPACLLDWRGARLILSGAASLYAAGALKVAQQRIDAPVRVPRVEACDRYTKPVEA